jgi:hypothetical protein
VLPAVSKPPEPVAVEAPPPPPSPLADSAVLAARAPKAALRTRVIAAVDFLLARNGVATADAFAAAMGSHRSRVDGLVSVLSEVLNVDGYQVIAFDRRERQVHLDRDKLAQQFEVDL